MHDTARLTGKAFFDLYYQPGMFIADIGSMDINGSLREFAPTDAYHGYDLVPGKGVDYVYEPRKLAEARVQAYDLVVSTSCFEHDDCFWATFLDILKILKPGGHFYLSAPVNGPYHTHPVDNWRFYPDAGLALAKWGRAQAFRSRLVESFLMPPLTDVWLDFVAVFALEPAQTPLERIALKFPQINLHTLRAEEHFSA
jgi:SAM-dependent methyltransferase